MTQGFASLLVMIPAPDAGVDLPGFGRCLIEMSDQDDTPAARGAPGNRVRRTAARDD
jgi:hypothetical protein